jgi:hypothetical protein
MIKVLKKTSLFNAVQLIQSHIYATTGFTHVGEHGLIRREQRQNERRWIGGNHFCGERRCNWEHGRIDRRWGVTLDRS